MRGVRVHRRWGRRVASESRRPTLLALEAFCASGSDDRYADLGALPPGAVAAPVRVPLAS
jgi:hypothetical protein